MVFIDEKTDGYLYNPVNDLLIEVPHLGASTETILWETWPLDKVRNAIPENKTVLWLLLGLRLTKLQVTYKLQYSLSKTTKQKYSQGTVHIS